MLAEGRQGWRRGGMGGEGGRVVDEPSVEAGPQLRFVAGVCQVQMLLHVQCL